MSSASAGEERTSEATGRSLATRSKWLGLAAEKGHHGAQALLGHMLFRGDGVPRQAARGLMLLTIASVYAKSGKDAWIHDLQVKDVGASSENERSAAAAYLAAHGKREMAAALAVPARAICTATAPTRDRANTAPAGVAATAAGVPAAATAAVPTRPRRPT